MITHRELVQRFGATTVDAIQASGTWMYRGTLYEDLLVRITVDSSEPDEAKAFLSQHKEVLKAHFRQLDIWITAHDVDLI